VKAAEIWEFDLESLKTKEIDLQDKLLTLKFEAAMGTLADRTAVRKLRRDIARVKTIIREKQGSKALTAVNKG
jgi:large subunit ribosomal protein L29